MTSAAALQKPRTKYTSQNRYSSQLSYIKSKAACLGDNTVIRTNLKFQTYQNAKGWIQVLNFLSMAFTPIFWEEMKFSWWKVLLMLAFYWRLQGTYRPNWVIYNQAVDLHTMIPKCSFNAEWMSFPSLKPGTSQIFCRSLQRTHRALGLNTRRLCWPLAVNRCKSGQTQNFTIHIGLFSWFKNDFLLSA